MNVDPPEVDDTLTPILTVERIEEDFYRGIATPGGRGRSFGGQVIAQALMAASHTVGPERRNHSLHVYFMRPGKAVEPVLYRVSRDMDGRSFATRRVVAIQGGKPILTMAASFQVEDAGLSHQEAFPDTITPPEELENELQLAERHPEVLNAETLAFLRLNRPIEVRPVGPTPPFDMAPREGTQYRWIRTRFPLADDPILHRAALAYTSDLGLLQAALTVHGRSWIDPGAKVASLDHALWLHGDFRMDDWLLYAMNSPWAGNSRGMTFGKIFTRDGRLVASVAQEGMLRVEDAAG
ncbi:acyl-CoA thioesterase II [Pseudooceanicola sediminis]|uniref:Acyl-CoA thioesterase 2 n=1 Tax=Pseudooceanicola sediminis TaxID=2211117 RepID=A0A399IXU0_9RHOB|nr:acyl-CoA thioesterase II [Pseudooceanicola sediminis]KAA2313132.1 acyl-CoA thioesterase II [Puniceibacterium sp. HSS470]RII37780.1 acyl-CoA thioesterase II [Pseudooceanicola sediminis]|tara:strand:+ start:78611 stop:79495 length:885 start_codon:yes stop_codon:yes gene_type:complete